MSDGKYALLTVWVRKHNLSGDDLFVTIMKRLSDGIEKGIANAELNKAKPEPSTLSETLDAILMRILVKEAIARLFSHRSGDTEDTTIAHSKAAVNADIKTGTALNVPQSITS